MPNEEEEEPTEDESSSEEEEEMEEEEREEEAEWDDAEADAKQQDVLQKAAAAASMSALTAAANARTAAATKTSAAVRGQPITLRLGLEADRRLKNAEKLLEQTSLTPADRAALIKMFGEDAGDKKELEARRKAVAELKIAQDRQFDEAEREDKAQEQKDRAADEAEVNEMMKKEAGEQRAQQEFAEAMKRGREQFEAGGGAQETPEERKKRRKDALKKMSGQGDIRASSSSCSTRRRTMTTTSPCWQTSCPLRLRRAATRRWSQSRVRSPTSPRALSVRAGRTSLSRRRTSFDSVSRSSNGSCARKK